MFQSSTIWLSDPSNNPNVNIKLSYCCIYITRTSVFPCRSSIATTPARSKDFPEAGAHLLDLPGIAALRTARPTLEKGLKEAVIGTTGTNAALDDDAIDESCTAAALHVPPQASSDMANKLVDVERVMFAIVKVALLPSRLGGEALPGQVCDQTSTKKHM